VCIVSSWAIEDHDLIDHHVALLGIRTRSLEEQQCSIWMQIYICVCGSFVHFIVTTKRQQLVVYIDRGRRILLVVNLFLLVFYITVGVKEH
jgi:hypothetical protein